MHVLVILKKIGSFLQEIQTLIDTNPLTQILFTIVLYYILNINFAKKRYKSLKNFIEILILIYNICVR